MARVKLIGVGKRNRVFRVELVLKGWGGDGVGENVVKKVCSCCSGKGEPFDLNGRRLIGEDLEAVVVGVALDVNQDIDFVMVDELGSLVVREASNVVEVIRVLFYFLSPVAVVVFSVGESMN